MEMNIIILLLGFAVPAVLAGKAGCEEHNNKGVLEFGPLPDFLGDFNNYYRVFLAGEAYFTLNANGLSQYSFQYMEYSQQKGYGRTVYSYYEILYKDGATTRILDYVRVKPQIPRNNQNLEDAILYADETPNRDRKLRMEFLTDDCSCYMRTYDLTKNDIPQLATTSSCEHPDTLINLMGVNDIIPLCDTSDNKGVMNEFGPLPSELTNPNLYNLMTSNFLGTNSLTLTDSLDKYMVIYNEYSSLYGSGTYRYGYLTLFYLDRTRSSYRTLDYLRVNIDSWKTIQQAIIDKKHVGRQISIKFLTSDCRCVQRVYKLDETDIVSSAISRDCNGVPIQTTPHTIPQEAKTTPTLPDVTQFHLTQLHPGCVKTNNIGVLDVFGPLPKDLTVAKYYYEVMSTWHYNKQYDLVAPLDKYKIKYSQYRSRLTGKQYFFLTLYYNENNVLKTIDYLRVHPGKWDYIQAAMLTADPIPDQFSTLRVRYLTADCTCRMRVYFLRNSESVPSKAETWSCNGRTNIDRELIPFDSASMEQLSLLRADKANYNRWNYK